MSFPVFGPGNAACRNLSKEQMRWFFTEPEDGSLYKKAQKICQDCPVRTACLEFALEHGEPGVWGGTTEAQRKRMRRFVS